uniref:Uncharacterized protein n=1 Tax=Parascaris equorum TaxID=6256 RepID=A0A914S5S8_PAREQ
MGDEQRRGSTLIDADEARNKETQNENGELKIGPLADLPKEQDTPTFVDCTSVPQLICEQESVCEIAGPSDTSKFFK